MSPILLNVICIHAAAILLLCESPVLHTFYKGLVGVQTNCPTNTICCHPRRFANIVTLHHKHNIILIPERAIAQKLVQIKWHRYNLKRSFIFLSSNEDPTSHFGSYYFHFLYRSEKFGLGRSNPTVLYCLNKKFHCLEQIFLS